MKRIEKAANKVRASMVEKLTAYDAKEEDISVRVESYKLDDGRVRYYAVVAYSYGPYDWTLNDNYTMYEELVGLGMDPKANPYKPELDPYYEVPKGYYAEPVNGYELAIYAA